MLICVGWREENDKHKIENSKVVVGTVPSVVSVKRLEPRMQMVRMNEL